ncbi:MAG: MogA/MoaB family molybdenum cofactor biosynthesis protein [Solirubrobacterales bacterium]|jgi:molybdopterin adenylyltransferase|nr:MogA/MoaB family molybdenum cofactor biosynthesis protein [Solirubrobacterales bacterium]MCW3039130.1 MogA/MoaB family molybdenum cofactor biosynthesis protein [Solirubrobacterales bacterium]
MRTAVLTVSTTVARREKEDLSGPALARLADAAGCDVVSLEVVSDDGGSIQDRLRHYVDTGIALVFTTGGTGFTRDDGTPEAALCVIERRATGLEAALHAEARARHPMGALSRAVAGIAGRTLIVTFPGSPRAVGELFPVVEPLLAHAVATLQRTGDSTPGH